MLHTRLITLPEAHVCVYSPGAEKSHSPSRGQMHSEAGSSHTPKRPQRRVACLSLFAQVSVAVESFAVSAHTPSAGHLHWLLQLARS